MANNIVTNSGKTVATDDVSSVHYPRTKIDFGVEGSAAPDCSVYRNLDTKATVGVAIKGSKARLFTITASNQHATLKRYLKLYNQVAAPASTDTPVMTIVLMPAITVVIPFDAGIGFSTGLGVRATGAIADNDNTDPTANDVVINVSYT